MRIFYVKNFDGETFLIFSPTGEPPLKLSDRWTSNNGSTWVDLYSAPSLSSQTWLPLLGISEIPEPSWEDEFPMEIHYKPIKCSYTYDT